MRSARNIIILSLFLFLLLLYSPLLEYLAAPLTVKDPPGRSQAIVVLSGGWEDAGQLGRSTLERYRYAIRLFQEGFAPLIIFSGGNLDDRPAEADEMSEMALSDGFSHQAVISENSSTTTRENVLFTKKILKDKNIRSIILVTSPYHMRRSKLMFEEKGVQVTAMPVPNSELQTAAGTRRLALTKVVLLEYLKFGLYKLGIAV